MRMIFLPGLGADRRIFEAQLAEFPEAEVPLWIPPTPEDNVRTYAKRLARSVADQSPGDTPCMVVGLSFGGVLAPYFAEEIGAQTCVVLSSSKEKSQFARRYYPLYLLFKYAPPLGRLFILTIKFFVACLLPFARLFLGKTRQSLLRQLWECDGQVQFYFVKMLMNWAYDPADASGIPAPPGVVIQIHGQRDRILPCRNFTPDFLIPRAGHILCMTHSRALNEILKNPSGHKNNSRERSGTQ